MREQYDARIGAFRCYFTGLPMEVGYGSRRSAEWAHREPGDESSVVLCCKLVNRMQTDLTEKLSFASSSSPWRGTSKAHRSTSRRSRVPSAREARA